MSSFAYSADHHAIDQRLFELCEEITASCDMEFDEVDEELEREFAELRLLLNEEA